MDCIKCNAANLPEARFCANCGSELLPAPLQAKSDEHTIKSLIVIIGLDYLGSIILFLIQKLLVPAMHQNEGISNLSLIYEYYGWTMDIVTIGALLFFLATIKNNYVKTALIVFLILRIIFILGYRVLPLFGF
jgi:hypothetical protein